MISFGIMTSIRLVLIIVASLFVSLSKAQLAETLMFSEKTYDFGPIKEADGAVIHEFSFINQSTDTVQITNVKASCGCTTPAWTKEPVAPGQSGIVQAQYNPRNRPGSFNKSLTVTFESSSEPVRLYIKGYVEPLPKTIEDELPAQMGGLRMRYRAFNLGKIKVQEEPVIKEFEVFNTTDSVIIFSDSVARPKHIAVEFEPQLLKAKQRGLVRLIYDAASLNDYGFRNDNVTLYTSEQAENSIKSISVYATLEEYFPPMTKDELDAAPKLKITKVTHDFGKVKAGQVVNTQFELTNLGESMLEIRAIKPNCACLKAEVDKMSLAKNESVTLNLEFNSSGRRGNQQKSIAIFSNDPRASAQRITIKAVVETANN